MLEPLPIREARAELAAGRDGEWARPAGGADVEIRPLPYPFTRFFTITSDCDNPRLRALLNVGTIVRHRYGLPVGDSYFGKWVYRHGMREEADGRAVFDRERFLERMGPWLHAFHRGWFDVLHNWIPRLMVKIARDVRLPAPEGGRVAKLDFEIPPEWHQREPPRYLLFKLRMPIAGSEIELRITSGGDAHAVRSHDAAMCRLDFNTCCLDLHPLVGTDPRALHEIEVEAEILGPEGAFAEVVEPVLASDLRGDILAQSAELARCNIAASVYTSHGGGYNVGKQAVASLAAADPRGIAEWPGSPHYAMDLFRAAGIDFFNTASNTASPDTTDIRALARPRCLNSGEVVYDFLRYVCVQRGPGGALDLAPFRIGGEQADYSHAEFIGHHVRGFLETPGPAWSGALLYTHSIVKSPLTADRLNDSIDVTFNDETHAALAALSDRYHNTSGEIADDDRVLVAPTSVLLRLSQVLQEIAHHAWYEPGENAVHVRSWLDPITGRRVPDARTSFRELRGVTFYVDDAHTARVVADGADVEGLVRNPPDATGRASVTVADTSTPTVVLGRVPMANRLELDVQTAGVVLAAGEDGAGTTLRLSGEAARGRLLVRPADLDLSDHQAISLAFRKSDPALRYRLVLATAGGTRLAMREAGLDGGPDDLVMEPWHDTARRQVVVPFHRFGAGAAGRRGVPVGKVEKIGIELDADGGDGAELHVEHLRLLRDSETPPTGDGFLIGGRISTETETESVEMDLDGRAYPATITTDGFFFVLKRVPRGSIVTLTARDGAGHPLAQRLVEVLADTVTIEL